MNHITLPSKIFEPNLPRFLSEMAREDQSREPVTLDFAKVDHWIPAAVVFTCALVKRWTEHRKVVFTGHTSCAAFGYLQRMDFFDQVGLQIPENFTRHNAGTSFVEIQEIKPGYAKLTEPLAQKLASCLAGTSDTSNDVFRFAEFSLGEVIANCQQHAEKPGFCAAQYIKNHDWARIGVADCGIGILESFRSSPHYREGMSHSEALELAMRPWVSSKRHIRTGPYGEASNRGVGLSMIRHMLCESYGELFIATGNAWLHFKGTTDILKGSLTANASIPGTMISMLFKRSQITDYYDLITEAQQSINLTHADEDTKFFQ